eukprot:Em0352g4a
MVEVEPSSQLIFRGPVSRELTSYVRIKNLSQRDVVFKVKTTAPRDYCVRPNGGHLPAGRDVTLAVITVPANLPASEVDRLRHRFLIQYMLAPPGYSEEQFEEVVRSFMPCYLTGADLGFWV